MKRLALAGIGAWTLLAVSGAPAWAHVRVPPQQQIKGLVTGVGGGSLHLQTPNGSATFGFTGDTHVTRIVTGSTADLAAGQTVDAQFAPGSTTIKWIRIELSHPAQRQDRGSRTSSTWIAHTSRPGGRSGWPGHPPSGVDGQVVSVTATSVTLRAHGQTQTYQLSNNVAVSKVLSARPGNLATGQTVLVCVNHGSTLAVWITILSS